MYIKRTDAIKAIEEWAVNLGNPKMLVREDAILALKYIPSAEPKRERCEYCKDGTFMGQRIMLGNDGKWHKILFCPNCGADMRNSSEKPNNCETCRHWWVSKEVCLLDDCKYEPMTEPTRSKMEQVDKDTNVRSKDCETCKWGE